MRTPNAARPPSAVAESEPHFDRLGGTVEGANTDIEKQVSPGAQAKPAGSTDPGFSDFEPVENQGVQEPKIDQSGRSVGIGVPANQRGHVRRSPTASAATLGPAVAQARATGPLAPSPG